ncbi:conserved hypothetical protein [Rhodopseudomonas palustris HaA2]|uniref:Uncharacterized protein n=1 Tax=Rhodopseudomonas palustris (strain HaA2) TaxID=316058 RepID=Q2IT18_RHOP2|nr:hypothetical protein [Rhodopseudomonas palustris]ABD08642.1 conserved hypothetical protein [Rhodopseudomonas palustris HaA2]
MDEHRKEPIIGDDKAGVGAVPDASASSAQASSDKASSAQASAVSAGGEAAASAESASEPAKRAEAASSEIAQRRPGNVTIMAPPRRQQDWSRHWDDEIEVEAPDEPGEPAAKPHGKRQLALAAVAVILAAIAGAAGGALTSAGFAQVGGSADATTQAQAQARALDEQVSKLQTELAALKASVDRADKTASAQIAKANDRIEKVEKAQAEPAQKIARLSETVEKLRSAQAEKPAPAPAQVASAAQDVTGSVPPKPAAKANDVGRLPTVEGWVLREVYDGGAVIVGRAGTFEVYAGDPVPGLGRVDAIRRQDGRWVVVTSRGLIVSR